MLTILALSLSCIFFFETQLIIYLLTCIYINSTHKDFSQTNLVTIYFDFVPIPFLISSSLVSVNIYSQLFGWEMINQCRGHIWVAQVLFAQISHRFFFFLKRNDHSICSFGFSRTSGCQVMVCGWIRKLYLSEVDVHHGMYLAFFGLQFIQHSPFNHPLGSCTTTDMHEHWLVRRTWCLYFRLLFNPCLFFVFLNWLLFVYSSLFFLLLQTASNSTDNFLDICSFSLNSLS